MEGKEKGREKQGGREKVGVAGMEKSTREQKGGGG